MDNDILYLNVRAAENIMEVMEDFIFLINQMQQLISQIFSRNMTFSFFLEQWYPVNNQVSDKF